MRTRSPSLCHRGSRMMLRVLLALLPALGVHTAAPSLLPGADTPPRGLNTWDSFRYWASEADLLANAKAMNDSGMVATGWQYLVVDEGWYRWSNIEQHEPRAAAAPDDTDTERSAEPVMGGLRSERALHAVAGPIPVRRGRRRAEATVLPAGGDGRAMRRPPHQRLAADRRQPEAPNPGRQWRDL